MPIKRPILANNEIYHIIARGVGDSLIFKDKDDYYRGIFSLYEFNNTNLIEIRKQRERRKKFKVSGGQTPASSFNYCSLKRSSSVDLFFYFAIPCRENFAVFSNLVFF